MNKIWHEYWWSDLLRDEIIIEHKIMPIDTEGGITLHSIDKKQIQKARERIKEKIKQFNDRFGKYNEGGY